MLGGSTTRFVDSFCLWDFSAVLKGHGCFSVGGEFEKQKSHF